MKWPSQIRDWSTDEFGYRSSSPFVRVQTGAKHKGNESRRLSINRAVQVSSGSWGVSLPSRSTGIPGRTGVKAAAVCGTHKFHCDEQCCFDPEAIADMASNLIGLERTLCKVARHV